MGNARTRNFVFHFHDVETPNNVERKAQLRYRVSSVSPGYIYCLDIDNDGRLVSQLIGMSLTYYLDVTAKRDDDQ